MKLNERMKRRLAVLGCVVVGAVLIAAIGSQFKERHRKQSDGGTDRTDRSGDSSSNTGLRQRKPKQRKKQSQPNRIS
ncbi:MAG: hypothetical protein ACLR0U_06700 [Enterocloster clostridioformis]